LKTLARELRNRLGPAPELESRPLVSIVVLNRNGAPQLRRLLQGLVERTDYAELELIVVDNGSSDESLDFVRTVEAPFPISILANHHNESFSDANNQGAELASGELLLFLNNDTEPFEPGWLAELVACRRETGAGAVGATLINPDDEGESASGYRVESNPWTLCERSDGMLGMKKVGTKVDPLDEGLGEDLESITLIAACLLIERTLFWEVGGFTHGFLYGGEDDDLALKLRVRGLATLYSGRSLLIHHASSTSRALHEGSGGASRQGNRLALLSRWGPRAWREFALGRLAGGNLWARAEPAGAGGPLSREEVLALGFCLRGDESVSAEIAALEAELTRRGHRCLSSPLEGPADPRTYLYDVSVHVRGASRHWATPGQLNVLWAVSHFNALRGIECSHYDLVAISESPLAARLSAVPEGPTVVALGEGDVAAALVDAVLHYAERVGFPMRIGPRADLEIGAPRRWRKQSVAEYTAAGGRPETGN
jgi:GT2 family glycosyltransferase